MSCESEEVLRLRTAEQIRGAMNCCGRMRSRMRRRDNKPVCAAADLGRKTAMKKIAFYDGWSFGQAGEEKRPVTLPHDAMLSGGRDASSPTGSAGAFFQAGVYEYEKTIDIPAEGGPATAILEFEGVMHGAKVYVNDVEAGGAAYGYIPFRVNLGAYVTPGGANVIRVVADNSAQPASRWYAGGGIYRPVWLWSGGKTVIAPDGVRVTTRSIDPPSAEVEVRTLGAQSAQDLTARVEIQICDAAPVCAEISIGADGRAKAVIDLPGAGLWSEETPNLYTCRVVLMDNGRIIDTAETLFGLRQVSWSSEGLFINGKNTLLRGGCVHHDNGLLGAASFDVSEYRRVKKLKEAGYNAIRSSHNPCSRAMLEACDALGVYLIDEGWDMWYNHKNPYDYAPDWRANHLADLKAMVDRDYNHPSVIMYSIGNEVSEPAKEEGVAAAKEMVEYLHGLDATRAVTGGFNLMIITQAKAAWGKDERPWIGTQPVNHPGLCPRRRSGEVPMPSRAGRGADAMGMKRLSRCILLHPRSRCS